MLDVVTKSLSSSQKPMQNTEQNEGETTYCDRNIYQTENCKT